MALESGRVGVRKDQVDPYGRIKGSTEDLESRVLALENAIQNIGSNILSFRANKVPTTVKGFSGKNDGLYLIVYRADASSSNGMASFMLTNGVIGKFTAFSGSTSLITPINDGFSVSTYTGNYTLIGDVGGLIVE